MTAAPLAVAAADEATSLIPETFNLLFGKTSRQLHVLLTHQMSSFVLCAYFYGSIFAMKKTVVFPPRYTIVL